MSSTIIIPARLNSSRFPDKPLLPIPVAIDQDIPMIRWVYDRISSHTKHRVIVATEDEEIASLLHPVNTVLTSSYNNGTEKCYAVAKHLDLPDSAIIMNWQCDEVRFDPANIEWLLDLQAAIPHEICTPCVQSTSHRPGDVYVVRSTDKRAMYFSRHQIPYNSDTKLKHVGIYTYTVQMLAKYCSFGLGKLEQSESLEQLRILENGGSIYVEEFSCDSLSINYPEDYNVFRKQEQSLYQ